MSPSSSFPHPETGELLVTEAEWASAIEAVEDRLRPIFRIRWALQAGYADAHAGAEIPRPRYRTVTQEKVARCPRCGNRLEEE